MRAMQSMSKAQSLSYATSPWHFLERPVSLAEAKVVITPMGDMVRFAGILELTRFDDSIGMRRIRGVQKAITYKKSAPLLLEGLKDGRKMFWDILPVLIIAFAAAGLMGKVLPRELLRSWMGVACSS